VVLVVDDVQWADRPTLLALLFALRRLEADRVLALLAGREEARTNLPEGLVRLFADERGATMQLEGLEVTDLQALGAALTGTRLPAQLAQHLRQHTGGSPLHARSLLEEVPLEKLGQGADAPLPSPQSFSAQVLRRLAGCPPGAGRHSRLAPPRLKTLLSAPERDPSAGRYPRSCAPLRDRLLQPPDRPAGHRRRTHTVRHLVSHRLRPGTR